MSLISRFREASSAIWSPEPCTVEPVVARTTPCASPALVLVAILRLLRSPVATVWKINIWVNISYNILQKSNKQILKL